MTPDVVLHQGDCLEVMAGMEAGSVDAIVTDPPFLNLEDEIAIVNPGLAPLREASATMTNPWGYSLEWIDVCSMFSPRHWVVFCNYAMLGDLYISLSRYARVMCVFVWRKSNAPYPARPVPRMDCEFIVWAKHADADCGRMREFKSMVIDVPTLQAGCISGERLLVPGGGKALHPCQKPLAVVRPFVDRLMEPPATILDPFAGTGTTGVACVKAGHRFVGIENDPKYIPIIRRRLRDAETPLFPAITGGSDRP